jgi:Ras-related GTP-binding protein A/B
MKSYLTNQKTTIFKDVGVLIYVFDIDSKHLEKDLEYYRLVLNALAKESEDAAVFVLIHKMDLARGNRESVFSKRRELIQEQKVPFQPSIFGTSIYDESLYEVCIPYFHRSGFSTRNIGLVACGPRSHTELRRDITASGKVCLYV